METIITWCITEFHLCLSVAVTRPAAPQWALLGRIGILGGLTKPGFC